VGIGVVLIVYLFFLLVVAAVCTAILSGLVRFLLKNAPDGRKKMVVFAMLLPFLCVAYAGAWFIGYAVINDTLFHRDPMIGDSWYTPLPNGYSIGMIDIPDRGAIYPTSSSSNDIAAIVGIRKLQLDGQWIWCAADSHWFGAQEGSENMDKFFLLNTENRTRIDFKSANEMEQEMSRRGTRAHLEPIVVVYQRYRTTWFEYSAAAILFLPPLTALFALMRRTLRLRASHVTMENTSSLS